VYHAHKDNEYYAPLDSGFKDGCAQCEEVKAKLIAFGEEYLDGIMSQEDAEKRASENLEWDMDAQSMLDFIKKNKW